MTPTGPGLSGRPRPEQTEALVPICSIGVGVPPTRPRNRAPAEKAVLAGPVTRRDTDVAQGRAARRLTDGATRVRGSVDARPVEALGRQACTGRADLS